MTKPLFSKSIRKHIRLQKARIRREIFDSQKQQERIQELYQRFARKLEKKEGQVVNPGRPATPQKGPIKARARQSKAVVSDSKKIALKKKEELVVAAKEK